MTLTAIDTGSPNWALLKATLDYNAKLSELALAMTGSTFECALKVWTAKSRSELADVVTNHTRDQFDAISDQVEEFSALMQKASTRTSEDADFSLGD